MKVLIPMAGAGSRFKVANNHTPKPLLKVNGKSLIEHSITSLGIDAEYIFVTRKFENANDNLELSRILQILKPGSKEICINSLTRGASETCLAATAFLDPNDELIITNCDQILNWNSGDFLQNSRKHEINGSILTFPSSDPRHSYAALDDNGHVINICEKKSITNNALVGVHYWRRAGDFIRSAQSQIDNLNNNSSKECYISESYNILINEGSKIGCFSVPPESFIPLGTPQDVAIYLGKTKEYYQEKPKTIFCDLDGTILHHYHSYSEMALSNVLVLSKAIDKLNEWDSFGHKIILCTARKESARTLTESQLSSLGIPYDYLLMGLTNGQRVLINDKLNSSDNDRALAVNLITNGGFECWDWDKHGL
jgi:dTDP-glucose pyrophosphorylase